MKHIVYKYVFRNEIIYIGKSDVGLRRAFAHGKNGDNIDKCGWGELNESDIYVAEFADNHMTDIYESELIRRYKPKYNKAKTNDWAGVPLPEPSWTLIKSSRESKTEKSWHQKYDTLLERCVKLQNEYDLMSSKCATYMIKAENPSINYIYVSDYARLEEAIRNGTQKITGEGVEWTDVIKKYRENKNRKPLCFVSLAYDGNGSLNCKKTIYEDEYGFLRFYFEQKGTVTACGTLLSSRMDTATYTNWNEFRCWVNRGSNMYYEVYLPSAEIKEGAVK